MTHTSEKIHLSVLQHTPTPADKSGSLERLESALQQVRKSRGSLPAMLLLPECGLTGYNVSVETAQAQAEDVNGHLCTTVSELARRYEVGVAFGFMERDAASGNDHDATLYNALRVVDETGALLSHYRKTHLWGDLDRQLFKAGDQLLQPVSWHGWRLALLICYDVEFPECVREHALAGADLVLTSTALMSPYTTVARQVVPVRAFENQLFIAYCNYCGDENGLDYVGHSCICAPDGQDLARAEATPELLMAELDRTQIARSRQQLPYHADRRPELYRRNLDH